MGLRRGRAVSDVETTNEEGQSVVAQAAPSRRARWTGVRTQEGRCETTTTGRTRCPNSTSDHPDSSRPGGLSLESGKQAARGASTASRRSGACGPGRWIRPPGTLARRGLLPAEPQEWRREGKLELDRPRPSGSAEEAAVRRDRGGAFRDAAVDLVDDVVTLAMSVWRKAGRSIG